MPHFLFSILNHICSYVGGAACRSSDQSHGIYCNLSSQTNVFLRGYQNDFLQLLQNTHHPASFLVQLSYDVFRYFLNNPVCRDCFLNIFLCVCDGYYTHPLTFIIWWVLILLIFSLPLSSLPPPTPASSGMLWLS